MVKDSKNLPFEVTYSEKPGQRAKNPMKRLAVLLKPEMVDGIIASLRKLNLESTVYDVKGAGKEKERVSSARGMGTMELAYTSRKVIATVVNANDVDKVVDVFRAALHGESSGVVMVSTVDDLIRL